MLLDPETCYRALIARDPRFDGCFFVGVSSTGVYCRPVCRVKAPKYQNCTFFSTAAAAEAAGFRPCLRCRPELAPGNGDIEAGLRIALCAARLIENADLADLDLGGVAARLGVTARHLRRVFDNEFGVSPVAFAQTCRLLTAKQLLTDTALSVTDVAYTAGFRSLRRFHSAFHARYRLTPRLIRKKFKRALQNDVVEFHLSYRPPYDWDALARFLALRAVSGVEAVDGSAYLRTVRLKRNGQTQTGWLQVSDDKSRRGVRVVLSSSLAKAAPAVLSRVKELMDLASHPSLICAALGPLAAANPGLRVPGAFDGFEIAVRAVLGQQVSVAAARTLAGRFAAAFGTPVESPFETLTTTFPAPDRMAHCEVAEIASLGILQTRARTILELSRALANGKIELSPGVEVEVTIEKLKSIPGIGDWTAQYIAMRALGWPDAFPHNDLLIRRALGQQSAKQVLEAAEAWRPWRAYATMHLWARGNNHGHVV